MPNMCRYHIKLNGTKKACYAFAFSQHSYHEPIVVSESGSDIEYELTIFGSWKESIGCYDSVDKYEGTIDLESHSLEEIKSNPNLFNLYNVEFTEKARILHCTVEFSYTVTEGFVYSYTGKIDNNGNLIEYIYEDGSGFDEDDSEENNCLADSSIELYDPFSHLNFDDIDNSDFDDKENK